MVELEYILSHPAIEEERRGRILDVPAELLQFSHFEMPVRFQVGGMNMFEWPGYDKEALAKLEADERERELAIQAEVIAQAPGGWTVMSVLSVAWTGLATLRLLKTADRSVYRDEDTNTQVTFSRTENRESLLVQSINGRNAIAAYRDLLDAYTSFGRRLRRDLTEAMPELVRHRTAGAWFRGDVEIPGDFNR